MKLTCREPNVPTCDRLLDTIKICHKKKTIWLTILLKITHVFNTIRAKEQFCSYVLT